MNQKEIISAVAEQTGQSKADVKEGLLATLDIIQGLLVEGDVAQFPGFGTFSTTERAARKGRNPQTGKAIDIAASTGVKFKAGATLKSTVKNG